MAENTILDLDALMDIEMDKVENVPDFVTPPAGNYVLKVVKAEIQKTEALPAKNGKPAKPAGTRIAIQYAITKVIELKDPKELPPAEGSMFSERFQGTESGVSYFKAKAMKILNVKDLSGARLKDVLDNLPEQEFTAKITIEQSEVDGKTYENVRVQPVHAAPAA